MRDSTIRSGIEDYLGPQPPCECGRTHFCDLESVHIRDGALEELPVLLRSWTPDPVLVVSDVNTETAVGREVKRLLDAAGVSWSQIIFPEHDLVPDETAVGRLMVSMPAHTGAIVAVGTGTINDLSRFASYRTGIPYCIAATAASMDGFASNAAPLIVDNLKTTFELGPPRAIVGDLTVLSHAPAHMTAAGAADVIAKCVALADWRLAEIVTGSPVCMPTWHMLEQAAVVAGASAEEACKGNGSALADLMQALVLSGIAINYIGNTRPASGSEHHLSHYWEMMSLLKRGDHGALHGEKVGVGTLIALDLYRMLPGWVEQMTSVSSHDYASFQPDAWEKDIRRAYGPAAPKVIQLERDHGKNADERVRRRRRVLADRLGDVRELAESLPDSAAVASQLSRLGLAVNPAELGVTGEELSDAVRYAKDLRVRYGLLQALFDLGVTDQAVQHVLDRWRCPGT